MKLLCTFAAPLVLLSFASAQPMERRPAYAVASVKLSDPKIAEGGISPFPSGIGYNAEHVTIREMLAVMYRVTTRQVTGGPDWAGSQRFDVVAKADQSYSIDELHAMFVDLLVERFGLKLHVQTRLLPAYVLTVAPAGLKMKSVEQGADRHSPLTEVSENRYAGDRVPLNYLCFWLGQNLQEDQRPVVDRTGLSGTYSFSLTFRPQVSPSSLADGEESKDLPSIFKAVQEQLGLVLTPTKADVPTIVIDHVEQPSSN